MKAAPQGIELLRVLAKEGLTIFSVNDARKAAHQIGMSQSYVLESLHYLAKHDWVVHLKKGLYAFSSESGFCSPPHEFAIAMALVNPCAISHWTAMHYHHITQQIPNKIFAITPSHTPIPRALQGKMYQFIRVKKESFFGYQTVWIDENKIQITDLERTLLDGLAMPQYCGDFQEVLHAFKMGLSEINLEKMIQYALKMNLAVVKRFGFIAEALGMSEEQLLPLLNVSCSGYRKLNPLGPMKGKYNAKWKIRDNLL